MNPGTGGIVSPSPNSVKSYNETNSVLYVFMTKTQFTGEKIWLVAAECGQLIGWTDSHIW
jgi:hypothetical protein